MQRSGTTLLRRIFTVHPDVRRVFHESFFLSKYQNKKLLNQHVLASGINQKKHIWGEKCPYYPNIRKIKVEKYCKTLNEWYPKKFKCVHVVRHPLDVANSNVSKFKYVKDINNPIKMYKNILSRIINGLNEMPYVIQIKYEHLLLEPDIVIPKIYKFCNLSPDVDFRKNLKKLANKKYQEIDPSRAFAHLKSEQKLKVSFDEVFKVVNTIEGPNY